MGFKNKSQAQRAQLSPPAAVDVAGEGGSRASPAPWSTKMRTTRCYKNSLDRPGSEEDPTSASRREQRDAAVRHSTEEWGWSKSPNPGVSPLEGHPPNGAGDGAGTAVMDEQHLWPPPKPHSQHSECDFKALQIKSIEALYCCLWLCEGRWLSSPR